jgi:hypothetical protein
MNTPRLLCITCRSPRQLHGLVKTIAAHTLEVQEVYRTAGFALLHFPRGKGLGQTEVEALAVRLHIRVVVWVLEGRLAEGTSAGLTGSDHEALEAWRAVGRRWLLERRRRAAQVTPHLVDRILDRIGRVGLGGLLPVERRLLDRYATGK